MTTTLTILGLIGRTLLSKGTSKTCDLIADRLRKRQIARQIQSALKNASNGNEVYGQTPTVHSERFTDELYRTLVARIVDADEDSVGRFLYGEQLITLSEERRDPEQVDRIHVYVTQVVREAAAGILGGDSTLQTELFLQAHEQQREHPDANLEELMRLLADGLGDLAAKLESVRQEVNAVGKDVRQSIAAVKEDALAGRIFIDEHNRLTEVERNSLDAKSRRRWDEIQELLARQNVHAAVAKGREFATWIGSDGQRASAAQRGRAYVLLAHLALMSSTRPVPNVEVMSAAREHFEQARREYSTESDDADKARLLALEAKLTFLDGDQQDAIDMLSGRTESSCVSTRLSFHLERGEFDRAAGCVKGLEPGEKWAANAIVAHIHEQDDSEADALLEWARTNGDATTLHQCLVTTAQARYQREVLDRFDRVSAASIDEAACFELKYVIGLIEPVLGDVYAARRVSTGLQANALGLATVVSHLLQRRVDCQANAELLEGYSPVHVHVALAVIRGDFTPSTPVTARLRDDHSDSFDELFLAAAIDGKFSDPAAAFEAAIELLELAETNEQKERLSALIHNLATGNEDRCHRAAVLMGRLLPEKHERLIRLQIEQLLRDRQSDDARRLLEACQDKDDPEWLQLSAEHLRQTDQLAAGAAELHKAAMLTSDPELLLFAGDAACQTGQYGLMADCFELLLTIEPDRYLLWNNLAIGYAQQGDHRRAADCMARFCAFRPDEVEHELFRAQQLALAGDLRAAIQVCQETTAAHPDHWRASVHLARHLCRDGNPDEAFATLHDVRERFRDEAEFLVVYMAIASDVEHEREGHEALQQILRLQREGRATETVVWEFDTREFHPLDFFRQRAEFRRNARQLLIQGRASWTLADHETHRSVYHGWVQRTQPLCVPDSSEARAEFCIYASNGMRLRQDGERRDFLLLDAPAEPQPVVMDLSAMLTLHSLQLLDRVAEFYGTVLYPVVYDEQNLAYSDKLRSQQRGARKCYESIIRAVEGSEPLIKLVDTEPVAVITKTELESDHTTIGLKVVAEWLHRNGRVDQEQRQRLEEMAGTALDADAPPVDALIVSGPIELHPSSFLPLSGAGCLEPLLHNVDIVVSADALTLARSEVADFEHSDRIAALQQDVWDYVTTCDRFQASTVEFEGEQEDDDETPELHFTIASVLLTNQHETTLIADDRWLQVACLGMRPEDELAACGTLEVLERMHDCGVLTDAEFANAFLQLVRWRYRFMIPPHPVLLHFARQYGGRCDPLREISRYAHDCMRDPGLPVGAESTMPPTSAAMYQCFSWASRLGRFAMLSWLDIQITTEAATELTSWAINECLPMPPTESTQAMQHILADGVAGQFLIGALVTGSTTEAFDRVRRAMDVFATMLGRDAAEYESLITNIVHALTEMPREFRQAMLIGGTVQEGQFLNSRSWLLGAELGLARIDLNSIGASGRRVCEVVVDSAHPDRIDLGPGPIVVARSDDDEDLLVASLIEHLFSPDPAIRRSVLDQLDGGHDWLSPRSREALAIHGDAARVEEFGQWYPAMSVIHDVIDPDFRMHLAALRQCESADLPEYDSILHRLLYPNPAHLFAIVNPGQTISQLQRELDEELPEDSLSNTCDAYMRRFGHLPLGETLGLSRVIENWSSDHGAANDEVWETLWHWADESPSPLRRFHVSQVYASNPGWIPEGRRAEFTAEFESHLPRGDDSNPDRTCCYWQVLVNLTQHYLFYLELHTPEIKDDRVPCQAFYTAREVTEAIFETCDEDAIADLVVQSNQIRSNTKFLWRTARPREFASLARHTILHTVSPWAASLISTLTTNAAEHEFEDESTGDQLQREMARYSHRTNPHQDRGLPVIWGFDFRADPLDAEPGLDSAVPGMADAEQTLSQLDAFEELSGAEQATVCENMLRLAARDSLPPGEVSTRLSDANWVTRVFLSADISSVRDLLDAFAAIQALGDAEFNDVLPRVLLWSAATLDIDEVRRKQLVYSGVIAATHGRAVSALRKVPNGPYQRLVLEELCVWRARALSVMPYAPPIVRARLRNAVASLHE